MLFLKKWEDLPNELKNDKIKEYYDILSKKKISLFLKRIFDVIMSFLMIVVLLPIFLIIAIWIKVDSKGTVFFKQERVTTNGKIFKIIKFRTMVKDADKKGTLVTVGNDARITRVGRFIRHLRIDELPQLFNVFVGDMSFVGTRPEVKKYVDKYTEEMKATLLMPAGITSKASLEYKDEDTVIAELQKQGKAVDDIYIEDVLPEKMKFNLEYIQKFTFFYDIKMCFKTLIGVLK